MTGASVVAVVGTLLGGVLGAVVQAWLARVGRRETRRAEALDAVTRLLAAVADHRRTSWVKEDLRLSGAGQDALLEARGATHGTRSAITAPLALVCILTPSLADVAEAAVQASYAMRDAADHAALEQLRAASVAAEKQLRAAASRVFARAA